MAWSAVSSAVLRISDLITQEATSLWGVEEQVDRLQRELRWMQSFLIDADARRGESERVSLWVSEIRDLAYDAEDVVETFAFRIGSRREGGCSNVVKRYACILKEAWMLRKIRSEIEAIITKITDLTQRLQTYGIKELRDGDSTSSHEKQERRRSYPYVVEDNVVGFNDKLKKLVSVITDVDGRSYRSVSICGMGGSGKTTLAKMIYHHSQVKSHFNHLAWVYVSQQCQRRKVWEDILSGLKILDNADIMKREEELAEKLYNFLKDNKCLVIVDDLWNIQAWDSIKPAFPARDTRSKILLTSRNKEVAAYVDRRGYLHELKCLGEENSWKLFQRIAFPDRSLPENRVDGKMEELGKDMVRHCAGLPLAIVVLGGILATKNSLNEWQRVSENVKLYLNRGRGQGIDDVLELSYEDLPPYLRPCFLHLSNFPEDYEIPADTLIQLWVAEGIVSLSKPDEENGLIEDVAEDYLNELVERCMIQVGKRDAFSKIKTCRMHDLMRALCLSKAKQENFLYIIDHSSENQRSSNSFSSTIRGVRRVSAHVFPQLQCIKSPHLRSLLFVFELDPQKEIKALTDPKMLKMMNYIYEHQKDVNYNPVSWILICRLKYMLWRSWAYMFNNFRLLRVLYFEKIVYDAGMNFPDDIGNLIHLRFLSLKGLSFVISKLPASLGNLRCLRTLDLRVHRFIWLDRTLSRPIHVPNVIWQMKQLRYLYLPKDCDSKTKLKLGTLRSLLTLVNFNTRNCYIGDLVNMINLRKLEISGAFHVEDFEDLGDNPPILGNNNKLRSLHIKSDESIDPRHLRHLLSNCANIYELRLSLKLGKLPEHHHFSSNITDIYLSGCKLGEDPMPTLGKLSNLRVLVLYDAAFLGKEIACSAQSFAKLKILWLDLIDNLEEWKVDEGAMPILRHLKIAGCKNLKMLPDGLRFVATLQELKIKRMPKAFKDKVVEGGEDFYKVQHIPSITFENCDK